MPFLILVMSNIVKNIILIGVNIKTEYPVLSIRLNLATKNKTRVHSYNFNSLDENFDFDSYYMMGISGGGWTTVLYSAIDDRISQSYSVAGTYPIFMRSDSKICVIMNKLFQNFIE